MWLSDTTPDRPSYAKISNATNKKQIKLGGLCETFMSSEAVRAWQWTTSRDGQCCVFPLSLSAWEVSHHWSVVQQGCLPSLSACYKSGREIAAGTSLRFLSALAHRDHSRGLKRQEHSTNLHLLPCLASTSDFSPSFCSGLRKVECPFSARFEICLATFVHFKQHSHPGIFYTDCIFQYVTQLLHNPCLKWLKG